MFYVTPPTAFYTLSLHDALPICILVFLWARTHVLLGHANGIRVGELERALRERDVLLTDVQRDLGDARVNLTADRKSTRLNSSHSQISYAVLCLKKKNV